MPRGHQCVFSVYRISVLQHFGLFSFVDVCEYCASHGFVWWYVTLEMLFATLQGRLCGAETEHCFL